MQPPDGLAVRVERAGATVLLLLEGELDLATGRFLQEALERVEHDPPQKLVIDLTGLSFIDNTGVYAVFSAVRRAARRGEGGLSIRPGPPSVQRVFRLVGVEAELPFVDP